MIEDVLQTLACPFLVVYNDHGQPRLFPQVRVFYCDHVGARTLEKI